MLHSIPRTALYVFIIIATAIASVVLDSTIYVISMLTDALCEFIQLTFTGLLIWHILMNKRGE